MVVFRTDATLMMVGESDERLWHFKQLRWSLQGLAASASDQGSLFPGRAVTANELALDFDHWASVIREKYGGELEGVQRAAIDAIDQTFARMSRDGSAFDADIWTETALKTSEYWASVRQLAVSALHAFGWPSDDPSNDSAHRGTEPVD